MIFKRTVCTVHLRTPLAPTVMEFLPREPRTWGPLSPGIVPIASETPVRRGGMPLRPWSGWRPTTGTTTIPISGVPVKSSWRGPDRGPTTVVTAPPYLRGGENLRTLGEGDLRLHPRRGDLLLLELTGDLLLGERLGDLRGDRLRLGDCDRRREPCLLEPAPRGGDLDLRTLEWSVLSAGLPSPLAWGAFPSEATRASAPSAPAGPGFVDSSWLTFTTLEATLSTRGRAGD